LLSFIDKDVCVVRSSAGPVIVVIVALGLLFLLAYVGAIGPIVRLSDLGYVDAGEDSAIAWIYTPVIVAAENLPPVDFALSWYISLWDGPLPTLPPSSVAPQNPLPPVTPRTSPAANYSAAP
jgi:hypothetical protein